MKRLSLLLLAILVCSGCHAPMPSFNLLAAYGPTRIPPPATGSLQADTYYQPGRQSKPAVGTGFRARQSSTNLSADASASTQRRSAGQSNQTVRASHETTTVVPTTLVPSKTVVQSHGPIQIVESGPARPLPPNVRGMRINEATVEPGRFFPAVNVIDITQLPPASSARYANVVPMNQAVGTSVVQASASSRTSSRSTVSSGGWHSRN